MDDRGNLQTFESDAAALEAGFKIKLSALQTEQLGRLRPDERAWWHEECQRKSQILPIPAPGDLELAKEEESRRWERRASRRVPGPGSKVAGTFKKRR